MSRLMEELIHDRNIEIALDALKMKKNSLEEIAALSHLSLDEVKKLSEGQHT